MTIRLQETPDHRISLSFDYNPDDHAFVKSFTGRQFDWDTKAWLIPSTEQNLEKIRQNARRFGGAVDEVLERVQQRKAAVVQASQAFAASKDFHVREGLGGKLRPYQEAGVEFITRHAKGKAYIGDEMGLGKTITALAAVHQEQAYPALVICPAVVVGNWKREANTWLPDKQVQIIKSGKDAIDPKADIVIASYNLAAKMAMGYKPFQQVICDEAHYLKNYKAKRTQAVVDIAKRSPRRLLLSGTPITNKPKDLFSQLEIIDVAGKGKPLGNFFAFARRYCGGQQGEYGFEADGATNIEELNERLRQGVYLRRDKKRVLTELPEKQRQYIPVGIPTETRKRLREIEAEYQLDSKNHVAGATLKAMTNEMVAVGLGKIQAAAEFMEDFAEEGKKLIIFSNLKEVQQGLLAKARELGVPTVHILGEDSSEKREQAVRQFQENPNVRFAICSLKAAGVGITLTAASDVLMVEQDWTPANLDQAEDRAHRMGQKNAVNVTYLIMEGTLDDTLRDVIDHKRKIAADLSQSVQSDVLAKWRETHEPRQGKEKSKGKGIQA
jgi:SWI/SNF-related matrix-associated actin-dependent regulator 1 of chromatin subfamily A